MAVLLFFGLLAGFAGWLWVRNLPAAQRKPAILKLLIIGTVAGVGFLALTGRFYLVLALLAGLFPLLRRLLPGLLMGRVFRGFGMPGTEEVGPAPVPVTSQRSPARYWKCRWITIAVT